MVRCVRLDPFGEQYHYPCPSLSQPLHQFCCPPSETDNYCCLQPSSFPSSSSSNTYSQNSPDMSYDWNDFHDNYDDDDSNVWVISVFATVAVLLLFLACLCMCCPFCFLYKRLRTRHGRTINAGASSANVLITTNQPASTAPLTSGSSQPLAPAAGYPYPQSGYPVPNQYPAQPGVPYVPQQAGGYPAQAGAPYPTQAGAPYYAQAGAPYPVQAGAPYPASFSPPTPGDVPPPYDSSVPPADPPYNPYFQPAKEKI